MQSKKSIAFDALCIELQYAFVAPSDELLASNYLNLQSYKSSISASPIAYHVPPIVFEQSRLLLRPSTYKEIVEERAALKQCGLPICRNKLQSVPNQNKVYYRLNLSKKEILQETDTCFCGKQCHLKSREFEMNLEDVAIQYKSQSLEQTKQALQFIFSWYKGKLIIKPKQNPPHSLPADSLTTDPNMDVAFGDDDNNENDENTEKKQSTQPCVKELSKKMQDLEIVEKNVAFNLHQQEESKQKKKKWKRPVAHQSNPKATQPTQTVVRMEVDDNKNEDDDAEEPVPQITMTKMEEFFRIQQEEKLRMKQEVEARTKKQSQSKDNENKKKDKPIKTDKNGRKIKQNTKLDQETLAKIEAEKARIEKEEKHRMLYNSMSDNAQLMGYYIGWVSDATTFFVMNKHESYNHWKQKKSEYAEQYSEPILKQRQQSLVSNVVKYVTGLLNKFNVNPTLTSAICNEIHLLVDTFDISSAIPSFTAKTWCFISFVFLKLISHRITALKPQMFDKQEKVNLVLNTIGYDENYVTTFEQIVVLED